MHQYVAFLGNHPSLSIAELSSLLTDFSLDECDGNLAFFHTKTALIQEWFDTLGGCIVLAKRIIESDVSLSDIPSILATECEGVQGKAVFALRFSRIAPRSAEPLYRETKQLLKERGLSSRYIGSSSEAAKPIQLHDEGLLEPSTGCELVVLQRKNELWVGRTVAAQNIKAYTRRDMDKPFRDTKVGLLPPKLAQILINLGVGVLRNDAKKKAPTIYDPFCGTGVILLEALLQKFPILGSDMSEKAVKGAEENIAWMRKQYAILKKDVTSSVWKHDVRKAFDSSLCPDILITEGTLGPALNDRPTVKDAEILKKESDELVATFLKNAKKAFPKTPIVMTVPIWYAQKRLIWLTNIWKVLSDIGYTAVLPDGISPSMEERPSLIYRRPDQFVGREVIMLLPC